MEPIRSGKKSYFLNGSIIKWGGGEGKSLAIRNKIRFLIHFYFGAIQK